MSGTNSFIKCLRCPKCDETYRHDRLTNLCACGSPLLVDYDLTGARAVLDKEVFAGRGRGMWRYRELLPVLDDDNIVSLGEGDSPMLTLPRAGEAIGVPGLCVKDEGVAPTGTFKARGASAGVSKARELGARAVVMPTNGNAGAAWALYCARASLEAVIVMPEGAPRVARAECAAAGARLFLVDGLISDCGKIVAAAVGKRGWFDVSTLKEPYRVEGKKTMGYEIAEHFGWRAPDVILYPTGGGVGLIGVRKAFAEMAELGWTDGRLPRLVAVQADNCAPIVKAFREGRRESDFWPNSSTVAFGINVPKAIGDFLVLDALRETRGAAISVSDGDIAASQAELGRLEGVFVCPEGAALYAAARRLREDQWIRGDETVVMLNTGAGIKYPDSVRADPPRLAPGDEL